MYAKVLVSIDNSDRSQQVFDEAVFFTKQTGASLMLVHILSPSDEKYVDSLFIQPAILDEELLTETEKKNLSDWN